MKKFLKFLKEIFIGFHIQNPYSIIYATLWTLDLHTDRSKLKDEKMDGDEK